MALIALAAWLLWEGVTAMSSVSPMSPVTQHWARNLLRAVVLFAAAVSVLAIAGCSLLGTPAARPASLASTAVATATTMTSATPLKSVGLPPQVTATLGPPPTNCPVAPPPHTMTVNDFGGGFSGTTTFLGGSPAWELGFGSDGALAVSGTPYPSTKVMWVVGPNVRQPVTLSGHDLRSGIPLWFEVYPSNLAGRTDYYTTSAVLDPATPNRGATTNATGTWKIWGIGMIVSAASCYEVDVTSAAGSWHTVVAAGTVHP